MREIAYVMLKPDCLQLQLQETIAENLLSASHAELVALDEMPAKAHQILAHCEKLIRAQQGQRNIVQQLLDYYVGQKIWAMVLSGNDISTRLRSLIGASDPSAAEPGTIRGRYSGDSFARAYAEGRMVRNLVHCSDNTQEALGEIDIWFAGGITKDHLERALTVSTRILDR